MYVQILHIHVHACTINLSTQIVTYIQWHNPVCRWIEACLEEELPPTTELEQALRNGVILGKLGHYYAPEVVSLRRIYDIDEAKYRVREVSKGVNAIGC